MASKDYEVGYKRPPKNTQFQPGQSGNPKGRPKGTRNLATDLAEELEQKILITEGGKQQWTTKQQAVIKTLIAKAVKGETRAADVLIKLILGIEEARNAQSSSEEISEEDETILAQYRESLLRELESSRGAQEK